jgi:hypothetical protein
VNVDTYEAAWRRYRKWRVWSTALQVGVVLVMLTLYEAWRGRISMAWAIVVFLAFIVAAVLVGEWPCPRCGKGFVPLWWYLWVARRCYQCGLPKWSVGP